MPKSIKVIEQNGKKKERGNYNFKGKDDRLGGFFFYN